MSSLPVRVLSSVGHLDRLRVVADHALHELDVGRGVLHARQIGRLVGADHASGLSGRARLHDLRRASCVAGCDRACGAGAGDAVVPPAAVRHAAPTAAMRTSANTRCAMTV